ncbi:MAG: multicopper oxidase domain-containing protein [Gemmatimonadales bacterium]
MAGLVLGIEVSDPRGPAKPAQPDRVLRLVAREASGGDGSTGPKGFTLAERGGRAVDSLTVPGPPILLSKGQLAAITVVNTLAEPATIHWHGMELESVFDGVAGWSGIGRRLAPLIAPGDSFTVRMAPPRAGTFIYHSHMDETDQLRRGMYGPLLVLEPGAPFDPERDHVFIAALAADGDSVTQAVNGQVTPLAYPVRSGTRHRLRFINIDPDDTVEISLVAGPALLRWRPLASDGADLPAALAVEGPARIRLSPGETRDVEWSPPDSGSAELVFRWDFIGLPDLTRRVPIPTR